MKPPKFPFMLSFIFLLSMSATSCKKDISGCLDPTADNHSHIANVDDGNCSYHGYLTPWYNNTTRDSLLANNIESVTVFVDNQTFANINPNFILWSSEPECSTTTIGNWVTIQGAKSKSITVITRAFDGSNTVVRQWTETVEIQSDSCELYQLIW